MSHDTSRRTILKMFGVAAVAAAPPACEMVHAKERYVIGSTAADEDIAAQALQNPMALPLTPPQGMTYNWKRVFTTKEEPDFRNIADMIAHGWMPVPRERHPELGFGEGAYWVEFGGLVLMEKPTKDLPAARACPLPWGAGRLDA
jgi:hypothetical protein